MWERSPKLTVLKHAHPVHGINKTKLQLTIRNWVEICLDSAEIVVGRGYCLYWTVCWEESEAEERHGHAPHTPYSLGLLRPSLVCGSSGDGVGVLSKGERELLKSLKCDSCHVREGSPKTYKRLIYAMSVLPMCVCVSVCEINELTEWLASQSLINSEHRCNLHKSFSLLPPSPPLMQLLWRVLNDFVLSKVSEKVQPFVWHFSYSGASWTKSSESSFVENLISARNSISFWCVWAESLFEYCWDILTLDGISQSQFPCALQQQQKQQQQHGAVTKGKTHGSIFAWISRNKFDLSRWLFTLCSWPNSTTMHRIELDNYIIFIGPLICTIYICMCIVCV